MRKNNIFIASILLLLLSQTTLALHNDIDSSLANCTFEEYVAKFNYPLETHQITTEDGYILTFYRIQQSGTKIVPNKPVIYLQHGLLDSSFTWVVNTEHKAPGFILANQGFDVWMGNSRGNHFSLGHKTLNWEKDAAYWDFSWQEMSKYDIPAAFNYIANHTNQDKIDYIGHSQGTSIMFAALAEQDPVVLKYLGKCIATGPVAYVNHAEAMFVNLIKKENFVAVLKMFKLNYVMMPNLKVNKFAEIVCTFFPDFCGIFDQALANFDPKTDNLQRFNVIVGHYPDATSVKTLQHWQQMLKNPNSGDMKKFDYGYIGNLKKYGSIHAPSYAIDKINHKIYLVAGKYDRIADMTDAQLLHSKLPNSEFYAIEGGHGTFTWCNDISYFYQIISPILHNQTPSYQVSQE